MSRRCWAPPWPHCCSPWESSLDWQLTAGLFIAIGTGLTYNTLSEVIDRHIVLIVLICTAGGNVAASVIGPLIKRDLLKPARAARWTAICAIVFIAVFGSLAAYETSDILILPPLAVVWLSMAVIAAYDANRAMRQPTTVLNALKTGMIISTGLGLYVRLRHRPGDEKH